MSASAGSPPGRGWRELDPCETVRDLVLQDADGRRYVRINGAPQPSGYADAELIEIAELRRRLWRNGYRPLAVYSWDSAHSDPGKAPLGDGWHKRARQDPPEVIRFDKAAKHAANTGVLCDGLRAVDLDINDPERATAVHRLADVHLGEDAPTRYRDNSSRRLILYRAAEGQPTKRRLEGTTGEWTDNGGKKHYDAIEILGCGQQFVAYGRHPSGVDLHWSEGASPEETPFDELTAVEESFFTGFLRAAAELIGADPAQVEDRSNGQDRDPPRAAGNVSLQDIQTLASALAAIPVDGAHYDLFVRIGMGLYHETDGSAAGLGLWDQWCRQSQHYDADGLVKKWASFARENGRTVAAGTIYRLAQAQGWKFPPKPVIDPTPEPLALFDPWAALPPVPFPLEALPPVLRAYAEDRARTVGADVGAIAWTLLAACGAALDASIRLQMKERDRWLVPPFLWLALIGDPSTKKTPILDCAFDPLLRAQQVDIDAWQRELTEWKALPKKERDESREPVCRRRLITNDATIEAVEEILSRQNRGIAVVCDELPGWIGAIEKYGGSKGGAHNRAFWLQSYNGGSFTYDRVGRGSGAINNLAAAIVGGAQPDRLQRMGDITSDGLWQRFVSIIVAPASVGSDNPDAQAFRNYETLIYNLLRAPKGRRVKLSSEAQKIRVEVEKSVFDLEQNGTLGSTFTAFCGKLPGVWGRLALVLSQIEGEFQTEVDRTTAERANQLLFQSVLRNAAGIYASLGGGGMDAQATRSVAAYILAKQKGRVLASELSRDVRACRGMSVGQIADTVSPLVAGGWFEPNPDYQPTGWVVRPVVHQAFAVRAAQVAESRKALHDQITGKSPPENLVTS